MAAAIHASDRVNGCLAWSRRASVFGMELVAFMSQGVTRDSTAR